MKTVSIIGSFRKEENYAWVVEIITKLREAGVNVLSPAGTEVVDSVEDFVIFVSDDKSLSPIEIENITLEKIFASDIVYVCDVDGYIGNTTAYELGRCDIRGKEIYFMEYPEDISLRPDFIEVLSVDELINYITSGIKK